MDIYICFYYSSTCNMPENKMTDIKLDPFLLDEIRRQTTKALTGLEQLTEGVAQLAAEVRECRQILAGTVTVAEQRLERRESRHLPRVVAMSPGRYWPNSWPHWLQNQPPRYLGRVALTPNGPVTARLTHLG
jgi:hypothetical protein